MRARRLRGPPSSVPLFGRQGSTMVRSHATARRWATRVAVLSLVAIGFGALASTPALAVGSPTHTSLDSSRNPAPACSAVTFTATVHGTLLSPVGLVQFFDGASTLGGPRAVTPDFDEFLGAVVPTNHGSGSITVTLSGGTHAITAVYVGDDLPSGGGPLLQTVTAATSATAVTSTGGSVGPRPAVRLRRGSDQLMLGERRGLRPVQGRRRRSRRSSGRRRERPRVVRRLGPLGRKPCDRRVLHEQHDRRAGQQRLARGRAGS